MPLLLSLEVLIDRANFVILRVLLQTAFRDLHALIVQFERGHLKAKVLTVTKECTNISAAIETSPAFEARDHVAVKILHK